MADADLERVINMSLNKMAMSRSVRRGGASLHKHLLISSVLSKARCAYLETWFSDEAVEQSGSSSMSPVPTNSTNQIPDESQLELQSIDPRYFLQIENEIELPSDILNCVEKLGEDEVDSATAEMILGDLTMGLDSNDSGNSSSCFNSYLDLNPTPMSSSCPSTPTKSKRQRGWSLELDDDDSDDETENEPNPNLTNSSSSTKRNANSSSVAKRIRFSTLSNNSLSEDGGPPLLFGFNKVEDPNFSSQNPCNSPQTQLDPFFSSFKSSSFRTKKNQFEVDEIDEDDSFLLDALDDHDYHSHWVSGDLAKGKNDRRVPSSNGSSSSSSSSNSSSSGSDEEQDSMEVDTLTNLVQQIIFSQAQQNGKGKGTNLVRSLSTPDLCSRSGGAVGTNESDPSATSNIFGRIVGTSNRGVLTMTV